MEAKTKNKKQKIGSYTAIVLGWIVLCCCLEFSLPTVLEITQITDDKERDDLAAVSVGSGRILCIKTCLWLLLDFVRSFDCLFVC